MRQVGARQQRITGRLAPRDFVERELHVLAASERVFHARSLAQGQQADQRPFVFPQRLIAARVLQMDGDETIGGPHLAPARAARARTAESMRKQDHGMRSGARREMDAHRHVALAGGIDPRLVNHLEIGAKGQRAPTHGGQHDQQT